MSTDRRTFLATSVLAVAGAHCGKAAPNERVRLGFIGLGGRGTASAKWFNEEQDAEVAALSDVDSNTLGRAQKDFPDASAHPDFREILDDPEIDAVVISTGNHWHALAAIWACQAGKDVYVEKPVSHNIWEGRKIVEAARKYGRVVQGGTQQRSDDFQAELREFLRGGDEIGEIKSVRCNRYGRRDSIGKRDTPLASPDTVDYNLWLGPAQDIPIMRDRFHYDWHWVWNTGNGELGNWGPHILDDLRNVVFGDELAYPDKVISGGGRLAWNDAGESPNTHFTYFDCGGVPVIIDVHNLPYEKDARRNDVYFNKDGKGMPGFLYVECEGGYYAGGRGGGTAYDADGKKLRQFNGNAGKAHARNFLDCVKSRNSEELNAEIEQIHYSSAWCHLGNIGYRLGTEFNRADAPAAVDSPMWAEVLENLDAHAERNQLDLAAENLQLGPMLEIDAENETFVGDTATPEALALLRREYRAPFEVPSEV